MPIKKRITLKKKSKKGNTKGNNPMGRPICYSDMIGAYICREIQIGRTITSISKDKDIPALATIYTWLNPLHPNHQEDFLKSYMVARKIQAETLADQALDIADTENIRTYTSTKYNCLKQIIERKVIEKEDTNQRQLQIDTRFKAARYLHPNKYSDKVQLTGNDGSDLVPLVPTVINYTFIKGEKK